MNALLILNGVLAAVSIGFAVTGAVRPAAMTHSPAPSAGERFYGWMYAVRAVPLGAAALVVPFLWPGRACAGVLVAAAVAQAGDAAIGSNRKEWTMLAGGLVAAVVHAVTAVAVATS